MTTGHAPGGPHIRRLDAGDDLDHFGRIVLASYVALPGHPPEPGYEEQLRDVADRVARGIVLGAFVDDRPAGCVTFVPDPHGPFAEDLRAGESSFRMLAVDRATQGRGVGEALVRACLTEARSVGSDAVFIYSGDWMTAAHRLYARLGFERRPDRDRSFDEDPPFTLLGLIRAL